MEFRLTEPWRGLFVSPDEGDRLVFNGTERRMKVTSSDTEGHLTAFVSTYPVGLPHHLHIHHDAIESFYVLEGAARFLIDGEIREALPGSFLSIPRGVTHGFVPTAELTRVLVLFTPAAMEGFWEELAAIEAGTIDQTDPGALFAKHNIEPVGAFPQELFEALPRSDGST